ncbi:MAG: RNHCP domain-containing protein [bacterium]
MDNSKINFIFKNEQFKCEHCGEEVQPQKGTCRNHCPFCLYSKHVDEFTPGDRKSICGGLMKSEGYEKQGDKIYILHSCNNCNKKIRNKTAPDDDLDRLF